MCPMFRSESLSHVFATIDDEKCQSGWGLDSVWPSLLSAKGVAVIDVVQIEHTRPPNAFASTTTSSSSYANLDPRSEELALLSRYHVAPFVKRVLEIVEEEDDV